jgi:hypothetical protein
MNITCNFVAPAKEHRWHHIWPSSVGSYGLVFVFASHRSPSYSLCRTSFTRTPLSLKSRFSSTHSFRYRMCHRLFILPLYMSLKPILQLPDKVTAALQTRIYFHDLKSHTLNTRPIKLESEWRHTMKTFISTSGTGDSMSFCNSLFLYSSLSIPSLSSVLSSLSFCYSLPLARGPWEQSV